MFKNFTCAITIEGEVWLLYFVFDTKRLRYRITVLNNGTMTPFEMVMISHYYWKTIDGKNRKIKRAEQQLNEMIQHHNEACYLQPAV